MKQRMLALVVAMICSSATYAQTVDVILTKYYQNTGGIEKWKALQGIKISAKISQGGMEIPFEKYQLKDGRQMTVINFQGTKIMRNVFDGTTLWGHNFANMKLEKSDAEKTDNFKKEETDFPDSFLNYKVRGFKIELMGKEKVDGTDAFKLKVTKNPIKVDGVVVENVVFYYFDTDFYVPVMMEQEIKSGQGKGSISQIKISEYQDVSGLMMPFGLLQGVKGGPLAPLTIAAIEINPKVDDAEFKFPEAK